VPLVHAAAHCGCGDGSAGPAAVGGAAATAACGKQEEGRASLGVAWALLACSMLVVALTSTRGGGAWAGRASPHWPHWQRLHAMAAVIKARCFSPYFKARAFSTSGSGNFRLHQDLLALVWGPGGQLRESLAIGRSPWPKLAVG